MATHAVQAFKRMSVSFPAETYERLDDGALAHWLGLPALRRDLLAHAHGDVLEVAVGTGLNLPFFTSPPVASLTALDISEGMLAQASSISMRTCCMLP